MAEHNNFGKQGEDFAKQYLIDNGYKILETNWRSGHLEIDIIAQKYDFLSIIEVKTRASNAYGYPEEFINKAKMRNLVRAAEVYILRKGYQHGARFEIISLTKKGDTFEVEHF
ncbi:MAG: YraN family protein, partial [Tannerella sp.]|nr:YraN family protein [Tannerella sp.]